MLDSTCALTSPPLQRFTRYFHTLTSARNGTFTPEMLNYFQNLCANASQVKQVIEWCTQNKIACPLSSVHVAAADKRAQDIQANATQQASAAALKSAALLRKVASAAAINQRTYLIGITDDDTTASDYTTVVWNVDSGSFLGSLRLRTLASVATAVGPYLTHLRMLAQLGEAASIKKYAETSILAVKDAYKDSHHMHVVFGALEIKRHATVAEMGLGTYADIAESEKTRVENVMHDGARCIQAINDEIRDLSDLHQNTGDMVTLRNSCCALLVEYSVFYNTVFAFTDFLKGNWGDFAASFLPYQGAVYGVSRFPPVGQIIHDRDDKPAPVLTGRNPFNSSMYTFSTLRPSEDGDWVYPSTTHAYEESLALTVANVLAPPQTFATVLVLGALATKSLSDALCVAMCVAEVQSLYSTAPDVALLVRAACDGQWVKVLQLADAALAKYVEGDAFLSPSLAAKLRAQVTVVACYHVLTACDEVSLAALAEATGLRRMEAEKVATQLIRDGVLQARINRVEGKITRVIPTDAYSAEALLRKTLCETETAITHAETQLQLLSVQRHLVTASVYSVDPQHWGRLSSRAHDALCEESTF